MTADVTMIPTKTSQGAEWIIWYDAMKSKFGQAIANQEFLKAWSTRQSSDANTHELRDELSKNGVDIDKGVLSGLYDTGAGVVDKIGSFLNVGKYAIYAIGGILILGVAGMVFQIVRNPGAVAGTAARAAI